MQRKEIVTVCNIYNRINQDIEQSNLHHQSKSFPRCSLERTDIWMDTSGDVRKYVVQGGSDDSWMRKEVYYDDKAVQFIFITYNNVHGAKQEYRIYYGPTQLIYFDVRNLGIDYSTFTLGDLVTGDLFTPRQSFDGTNCDN